MPQFFAPSGPDAAAGPVGLVGAPVLAAHRALVGAPDLHCLADALSSMAQGLVDHLGFDRAMALRTGPRLLAVTGAAFREQPDLAREALHHAERHPVELRRDSLELEMMRRRAPALVVPVGDSRAWHPITDQLRTRAYVAAPVEAFGRTVATLHADAHFAGREVGADDRTAIGVFAQVCRGVAERALLAEQVERLRAGVRANGEELLALSARDPVDAAVAPTEVAADRWECTHPC